MAHPSGDSWHTLAVLGWVYVPGMVEDVGHGKGWYRMAEDGRGW